MKYLDNVVEADHGKLKQLIRPVRGFKALKTAYATIKGFEVMHALRKGQARFFNLEGGIVEETVPGDSGISQTRVQPGNPPFLTQCQLHSGKLSASTAIARSISALLRSRRP